MWLCVLILSQARMQQWENEISISCHSLILLEAAIHHVPTDQVTSQIIQMRKYCLLETAELNL